MTGSLGEHSEKRAAPLSLVQEPRGLGHAQHLASGWAAGRAGDGGEKRPCAVDRIIYFDYS